MTKYGSSAVGNRGLENLNGNVLCAIDTETTGLKAGFHDVIEVAIVPLDTNLDIMQEVPPFHMILQPKRPERITAEAMKVNGFSLDQLMIEGMDPWRAADLFDSWFQRLKLAPGKKISPLGKNWPFDKGFIEDWVGPETFNQCFHYHYRDVGPVALFMNDRAEFQTPGKFPFPKTSLQYVATTLGIETDRAHRALEDAVVTAKVYKKMMTMKLD